MDKDILKKRTKQFTIDVIKVCYEYNNDFLIFEICKQLIRSSSSVGANYRSAFRAKSLADFSNKLKIVLEEADESQFWLELIEETKSQDNQELKRLQNEANEIVAICVASLKTVTAKLNTKT